MFTEGGPLVQHRVAVLLVRVLGMYEMIGKKVVV